ncbi:MAG TPA: beta-N-acetylglucosaminidase domain-containing protein, partial [Acidimicrobiales bacterium]|nr:beta-N-acetylglucosaminidase domain-containing protein [Acidimicrobiales bacterium]
LFVGPLRGREPGLDAVCSGYVANPMVQPRASRLPLASTAAYLAGADPERAWRDEADALGWRVFAEACDGAWPGHLVAAAIGPDAPRDTIDLLDAWLDAASSCTAPGLEDEAGPWLDQVHAEADLGRLAVRLLRRRADDPDAATGELSMAVALTWQALRRAPITVMGARCSVRPMLWHDAHGDWHWDPASVTSDANAIDALVRFSLGL